LGNLKGRDHSENLSINGKNIGVDLQKIGWELWSGCIWLRIGTSGGPS
jgi:hypothetical protein